jgi:hypothetical protein
MSTTDPHLPDPPTWHRRTRLATSLLATVLVLGVAGLTWWDRSTDAALADAEAGRTALLDQVVALHREGEHLLLRADGQVADTTVLDGLAAAVAEAGASVDVPVTDEGSRRQRTDRARAHTERLRDALGHLEDHIAVVTDAHHRWVHDTAVADRAAALGELSLAVDAGTAALAASEGRVPDDALRTTLRASIDAAVAAADDAAPTEADGLTAAAVALREHAGLLAIATQAVLDAQAVWEAEQDRLAAEAAAVAGSGSGSSGRGGGSGAAGASGGRSGGSSGAGSGGWGAAGSADPGAGGSGSTGSTGGGSGGVWVEEPDGVDWGWCADTSGNAWEC